MNGCPLGPDICNGAALRGQLHILKYLLENVSPKPWSPATFYYAVKGGHQNIINYLRAQGCPNSNDKDNTALGLF